MNPRTARILRLIHANTRAIASTIAILLTMSLLVAVQSDRRPAGSTQDRADDSPYAVDGAYSQQPSVNGFVLGPDGTPIPIDSGGNGVRIDPRTGRPLPGPGLPSVRAPRGVNYQTKKIKIAFYWNDSSQNSEYLRGSGQEGNLDDGAAFATFIEFINRHKNGGRTFMGVPFNLQGFELAPIEIDDVGKDRANFDFWARELIHNTRYQPYAAFAARSSPSAALCPELAKAKMFNFGTYDFYANPDLAEVTDGYCRAFHISFERQVDIMINYLKWHQAQLYDNPSLPGPRQYGFIYAAYRGLTQSAPIVIQRMKAAGIKIVADYRVSTDLATAQTQMRGAIDHFRSKGVNTIISPDAGVPLNFTHAATANRYNPDYVVWPCSGQDSTGYVRLLNPAQWARASGLTCYDETFDADLTNDNRARTTEWYRQYREVTNDEPPAAAPLVYAQLAPILAGLTYAAPEFKPEKFAEGLRRFQGFKYSGVTGRTSETANISVDFGATDGSIWADVARVKWNPTQPRPGGTVGGYDYIGERRYRRGDTFS